MIERKIVEEKIREFRVEEFVSTKISNAGHSQTKLQKTPLGEKIVVSAAKPGLVVGRKGENIKQLTADLKKEFNLENPQIEIDEITQPNADAKIVAENIASALERFGPQRFKGIVHSVLNGVMETGALGVEIVVSGKVPSARSRNWRFYKGYLKKCGDISESGVDYSEAAAKLRSGVVGVKVSIMPPDTQLPDKIRFHDEIITEEASEVVDQKDSKEEPGEASEKDSDEASGEKDESDASEESSEEAPKKDADETSDESEKGSEEESESAEDSEEKTDAAEEQAEEKKE